MNITIRMIIYRKIRRNNKKNYLILSLPAHSPCFSLHLPPRCFRKLPSWPFPKAQGLHASIIGRSLGRSFANVPGNLSNNRAIFRNQLFRSELDVSENNGIPKSSILIGFSIINYHKLSILGYPYFWKHLTRFPKFNVELENDGNPERNPYIPGCLFQVPC